MSHAPQRWQCRIYREDDRAGAFELMRAVYGPRAVTERYWDWRYFSNPVGRTDVFVAVDGTRIIGMQPMAVLPARWHGESISAALYTGVMVDPQYRRRGVFSSLIRTCDAHAAASGASLVVTFPNENSFPAFRRLAEWREAGTMDLWMRLVRPTELFAARGFVLKSLAKVLGFAVWPALAYRPRRRRPPANIQPIDRFDRRHEKAAGQFAQRGCFMFERSAAYLNWRFVDHPEETYLRLAWLEADRALGYVVVNLREYAGVPTAFVVDLIAADPRIADELMHAALTASRERGIALAVATATHPTSRATLQSAGFRHVPEEVSPKHFYVVYRVLRLLRPRGPGPIRSRRWHLLLGDTDNI